MSTLITAETNAIIKLDLGCKGEYLQKVAQRMIPQLGVRCEGLRKQMGDSKTTQNRS